MFYSQRRTAPLAPCAPDCPARNRRSQAPPNQPRATSPARSVEWSFFFSLESKSNGCPLRSGSLLQLRGPICQQNDGCGFGAVGGEYGKMLAGPSLVPLGSAIVTALYRFSSFFL